MTGDTDIDFMDYETAREYVLDFITTLKKTRKQIDIIQGEILMWEKRVKLAEEKNEPVLKEGALAKAAELKAKNRILLDEERELKRNVSILKEKLKLVKTRSSLSVDADTLLTQLQMAVGERDTLDEQIKDTEAEEALEELKKKIKDNSE